MLACNGSRGVVNWKQPVRKPRRSKVTMLCEIENASKLFSRNKPVAAIVAREKPYQLICPRLQMPDA